MWQVLCVFSAGRYTAGNNGVRSLLAEVVYDHCWQKGCWYTSGSSSLGRYTSGSSSLGRYTADSSAAEAPLASAINARINLSVA